MSSYYECSICTLHGTRRDADKELEIFISYKDQILDEQMLSHYVHLCENCYHLYESVNFAQLYTLFHKTLNDPNTTFPKCSIISVGDATKEDIYEDDDFWGCDDDK